MPTNIQLRELSQSITDFTGYQLILLFKKAEGFPSSITLPVSTDGFTNFEYLNDLHVEGKINLALKAPTGNIITNRDVDNSKIINQSTFQFDFTFAKVDLGGSISPIIPKATTINGKLLDSTGTRKMDEIQIIIFASTFSSPPSEPLPILSTTTEASGYFFLPYPEGTFSTAYALVGLESATGKNKINITLDQNDTGKPVFSKRLLLVVEPEEGAAVVETKTDCGCNEFNFHEQKRILDEFSYYSIIRTSDPEIKAYSIAEEEEISLDDLLRVSPTSSNPIITGIIADPVSVFGHPLINASANAGTIAGLSAVAAAPGPSVPGATIPGAAAPPPANTNTDQVSAMIKNIKIWKSVVQQFLVTHKVLNNDTYRKLLEMNDAAKINEITQPKARVPIGRVSLDSNNQVDYDKDPTVYEATTIAYGHLLHFKQQWVVDGYSLGDLLYSLPLAPGQKKQIVITDFDSTVSGSESQEIDYEESLDNSLSRDRDVNEIATGVVNERVNGSSSSTVKSGSAGLGLALGPLVFGASGGISKGNSKAIQNSMRSTSARDAQHLSDQTVQSANAVRSQRSTVIRTVSQGERYEVTAESVANYNHCHAITIEYFQVMRHFKVQQRLVDVQECIFIPLPIVKFDIDKARRWKDVLQPALRDRGLRKSFDALQRVKDHWEHSDFPATTFAAEEVLNLTGNLKIKIDLTCPADKLEDQERIITMPIGGTYKEKYTVPVYDETQWTWLHDLGINPLDFYNAYIKNQTNKDDIFRRQLGDKIAQEIINQLDFKVIDDNGNVLAITLDASLSSIFYNGVPLAVTISSGFTGIPREKMIYLRISFKPGLGTKLPLYTKILVKSGSANYRTKHIAHYLFNYVSINDDLGESDTVMIYCGPSQAELRDPKEEDVELVNKLLYHLNANLEGYHNVMFKMMPEGRRHMLLDGINLYVEKEQRNRSVASLVVNKLIGIVGNSLVLPVIPGLNLNPDFAPKMLNEETGEVVPLIDYYAHEPLDPLRISVPTKGVFAEAMMGKCNSCEIKDEQRFWRWEESPIPDSPTAINPVSTPVPTVIQPNLQAASLANPVVNIQNAPNAPDPIGLSGVLNLLGKGDTFRDVTGLTENQRNALAGLQEAFKGATSSGTMGLDLKKANLASDVESKKLDLQSQQMENEKQMRQNKFNTMSGLLKDGKISLQDFNKYLETEGMSPDLKKMIDANNAERRGDINKDQNNTVNPSSKTEEQKIDSVKSKSQALLDAVGSGIMNIDDAQSLSPALYKKDLEISEPMMPGVPENLNALLQNPALLDKGLSFENPDFKFELKPAAYESTGGKSRLDRVRPWADFLGLKVPDDVVSELRTRGMEVQYVHNESYSNDLNIDLYPVRIDKFPTIEGNLLNEETLIMYIRKNINTLIDTSICNFQPYEEAIDAPVWNSPIPTKAVLKITMSPDNAAVVVSYSSKTSWIFSTITTPITGHHPVSGHRQFYMKNLDGTWLFVIKGLDMVSTGIAGLGLPIGGEYGYGKADELWRSMITKIVEFINSNGGDSKIYKPGIVSERHEWRYVYHRYKQLLESVFGAGAGSPGNSSFFDIFS